MENPNFVISNFDLAQKYKVKNISLGWSLGWIYQCIYHRRHISIEDFMISDHTVVDKYQQELELEFFDSNL